MLPLYSFSRLVESANLLFHCAGRRIYFAAYGDARQQMKFSVLECFRWILSDLA